MAPGDFYKRPCEDGLRFEVVMARAIDSPPSQAELEALHIRVDREAIIGHFAITLTQDTIGEDWLKVTSVVCGHIYDEHMHELPIAS
mgnify:CR=1 FL=1